jgi:hypothetical protein
LLIFLLSSEYAGGYTCRHEFHASQKCPALCRNPPVDVDVECFSIEYTALHRTNSIAYYSKIGPSPPTLWFGRYWKLIKPLHLHIGHLQSAVLKVSFSANYYSAGLVLKLSTILALAALADLHATFTPSHPESSRRYRDTLIKIVSVSSTFASDDFQSLTPILSVRGLNDALASIIYLHPSCVGRLRPRESLKIGSCTKINSPLSPRSDNAIRI